MTLRMLQICHSAHPPFADISRCYALAARANGWHADTVFLTGEPPPDLVGATSLRLRGSQLAGLKIRAWRRVRAQVAGPYGLVIAHRYKPLYLALLARLGPVVGVAHEFGLLDRAGRRLLLRLLGSRARLAGVSTAVSTELAACQLRLPVVTLPNVLDLDAPSAQHLERRAARALLGCTGDGVLIGHVGRLHHKKRLPLLIEAFGALCQRPGFAGSRLVLVGDGPERAALERQARALGCAEQIHFAGFVPDARRLLAALDVLVVSSGGAEAFGMTVLEGVAAGVPVVTSNLGGPAELFGPHLRRFRSGVAGSLVDALADTLDDPPDMDNLQAQLRERYSVPALAARLARLV